ncbi:prolipoprotein diacylglyceryl transferase [Mycoplasmopsis glycophila]|uniref:Phosphatidylglycerol--prolipoprotein diacylglyceryl transferase n=1 Tax=Mycoplasmopsis glycophila TaxID=171285 RepID=A0A449AWT4_9BACT|nr:prolipoprotein diacylglyceryl transferase [Mycoplasmopsis glycophila]VEU71225.1 Prolipoprotein diacylglyceryl transferase [Mycoplasmopsis glycophila]
MNFNLPSYVPDFAIAEGTPTTLFQIGNWSMNVYSLAIMLGFLCSILSIVFFWKREKYPIEILLSLIIITVPTSIIGSRLAFIIEQAIYGGDLSEWYAIWKGGLSIQGGIILTIIADLTYLYFKRSIIDMRKAASLIIPTILIGQVAGRWGNYSNHEVYGKIDWTGASSLIFGKSFASNMFISDDYSELLGLKGAYRYPLFLYEGIANLIGYLIIVWVFNLFWVFKPGATSGLYLVWYGIVRQAMEPLRQESYDFYKYLALIFIIIGTLVFVYYQFFGLVKYKLICTKEDSKFKFIYRNYEYANQEEYLSHVETSSLKYLYYKLKTR